MQAIAPLILGLRGTTLGADEEAFIRRVRPMAFLLFARNIESQEQVRALTARLAELSPLGYPLIAVDQEGGRVQRLHFGGRLPPMRAFGDWYARDSATALEATRLAALLLAAEVRAAGGTWALAPVLDLAHAKTHQIIGDRAFAADPLVVTALAEAHLQGTREGGCFGCLKHAPGHGRALADSHVELPVVDASRAELEADFMPFKALAHDCEFMMTAHIRYPALSDCAEPVTCDPVALQMMRREWGFEGLILADDLGMEALDGMYLERGSRALAAGCDVVVASLSKIKAGMAGTVFDEDSYAEMVEGYDLPPLNERALRVVSGLKLPTVPSEDMLEEARKRLRGLWGEALKREWLPARWQEYSLLA